MRIGISLLRNRDQTARSINRLSNKYQELGNWLRLPLPVFFNTVKNIPFKLDPAGREVTARPKYLKNPRLFPRMDCKKKAVLVQAWLKSRAIPSRLVAISERPDKKIHHVFPQAKMKTARGNKWLNVDATYPHFKLFAPKPYVTRAQVLA